MGVNDAVEMLEVAKAECVRLEREIAQLKALQQPNPEAVERAARAMFEDPLSAAEYSWAEMVVEDPKRADIWREDARRVLLAAALPIPATAEVLVPCDMTADCTATKHSKGCWRGHWGVSS